MMNTKMIQTLQAFLSKKRLDHVLRVRDTAIALAKHWSIDAQKAECAALCHDIAKHHTPDDAKQEGITLSEDVNELWTTYPTVWHAFAAPYYAIQLFEISDIETLDAMKYHTTGDEKMSPLSQLIFLADYIEPGRDYNTVPIIRELAYKNLDQACFAYASITVEKLKSQDSKIHPNTLNCLTYYSSVVSKEDRETITIQLRQASEI